MKRKLFLLSVFVITPLLASAEVGGGLCISAFNGISKASIGIEGTLFPLSFSKGRFSLGFDFGIELIERHLDHITDVHTDSIELDSIYYPDTLDFVQWFNKEYLDYMFIPMSILLRYDIGDPDKLSSIRASLILGFGGVLNIYQESGRQIQDWYYNGNPEYSPPDFRRAVDYGGESIATFDFYIKPKIVVYYQRFYVSYEHHFNTRYMRGSFSVGYLFRL